MQTSKVAQVGGDFFDSWGTFDKDVLEWVPGVSTVVGFNNIFHASAKSYMPTAVRVGSVVHSIIALVPGAGNLLCLVADLVVSAVRRIFGSTNRSSVLKDLN